MATWEDGPEYAPLARPDAFTVPELGPLDDPAPGVSPPPSAPAERPGFTDPAAPVAPLSTLIPPEGPGRDPQEPFDVASSTMTATDSAWSAAHWSPQPGPVPAPLPSPPPLPVPTWTPPPQTTWTPPAPSPSGPVGGPALPAPGTPEWFTPWSPPPPPPNQPVTFRRVVEAATPGLCLTLVMGGLVYVLAPITLLVAFGLSPRVKVATQAVRRTFAIALGVFAFFALLGGFGALLNGDGFSEWWGVVGVWALLISWVVLVVTLLQVARGLKAPPGGPSPWR